MNQEIYIKEERKKYRSKDLFLLSESETLDLVFTKKKIKSLKSELDSPKVWLTLEILDNSTGLDILIQPSLVTKSMKERI